MFSNKLLNQLRKTPLPAAVSVNNNNNNVFQDIMSVSNNIVLPTTVELDLSLFSKPQPVKQQTASSSIPSIINNAPTVIRRAISKHQLHFNEYKINNQNPKHEAKMNKLVKESALPSFCEMRFQEKLIGYGLIDNNNNHRRRQENNNNNNNNSNNDNSSNNVRTVIAVDFLVPNQSCLFMKKMGENNDELTSASSPSSPLSPEFWNKRVDVALKKRNLFSSSSSSASSKKKKDVKIVLPMQRLINGSEDGIPHIFVDLLYAEEQQSSSSSLSFDKVSLWMGCNSDSILKSGIFSTVYKRVVKNIMMAGKENNNNSTSNSTNNNSNINQDLNTNKKSSNNDDDDTIIREVIVSLDVKQCEWAQEMLKSIMEQQQQQKKPTAAASIDVLTGLISKFSIGSKVFPKNGHVVVEQEQEDDVTTMMMTKIDREPGVFPSFDRRLKNVRQFLRAMVEQKISSSSSSSMNIVCCQCDSVTGQYCFHQQMTGSGNNSSDESLSSSSMSMMTNFSFLSSNQNEVTKMKEYVDDRSAATAPVQSSSRRNRIEKSDNIIQKLQQDDELFRHHQNNDSSDTGTNNSSNLVVFQFLGSSETGMKRSVQILQLLIRKSMMAMKNKNSSNSNDEEEIMMLTLLAPKKVFLWPDKFLHQQPPTKNTSSSSSSSSMRSPRQLFQKTLSNLIEQLEDDNEIEDELSFEIVRTFNSISDESPVVMSTNNSTYVDDGDEDELGETTALVLSVRRSSVV